MALNESNLEPPTLSEVVRLISGLTGRIDDALKGVVTRYEYTADKTGIDLKFNRSEEIHIELKTLIVEVRGEAARDLAKLESKLDSYIVGQAEKKSKTNFLLAGAALSGVSALMLALFNRFVGG